MSRPLVGIDAMAFHGPECFVEMADLAEARGVDPAKYVKGLGQTQMAVATHLGSDERRRTVSLFSYGSGCGAALCFADVCGQAREYSARVDPQAELDARRRLDIDEYERVVRASEEADAYGTLIADPARWGVSGDQLYVGTVDHPRIYRRG